MKYIIGIDEVGRGPLAGPVTVGIVICEEKIYTKLKRDNSPAVNAGNLPALGKDSKKLSPELREKYSKYLKHIGVPYVVLHTSNKEIDKIGIAKCIRKSIEKGIGKIVDRKIENRNISILLDGGLKAPAQFKNQKTIIKGDVKEKIIAWASILAKVSRDDLMRKAHKKYPRYGFDKHKGYGTLSHRTAISKHGFSELHRKTYCRNIVIIKTK